MALVGPVGTTRSGEIHAALRRAILDGTYAPDAALPSERQLSDDLGASRHAVREALKRLQQAGLISISQGGATRVRDWRRHGGLDLLLALGTEAELPPEELGLVGAMFEMRASVGADAARLAARRAGPAVRAELQARAAALAATDDLVARTAIYDVLWDAIIDASGNLAYRLALNTLVAGQRVLSFDASVVGPEVGDAPAVAALAGAIARADEDAAFAAARALLVRSIPDTKA
ncbi:HTH-type transcriptional regulator Mce2R [Baekduia alba]|uniref:winged helix-turn-helix domain-containing protein n=1 Tax=Baekduia alba TaxID=2997333 RepID=UPI00234270B0|nr:winged helix-turn-helix domain-containing protein [Baekduia alba]WCB96782.1 HTH-type transcriptional regulator Mce2R [Baekduia alba]